MTSYFAGGFSCPEGWAPIDSDTNEPMEPVDRYKYTSDLYYLPPSVTFKDGEDRRKYFVKDARQQSRRTYGLSRREVSGQYKPSTLWASVNSQKADPSCMDSCHDLSRHKLFAFQGLIIVETIVRAILQNMLQGCRMPTAESPDYLHFIFGDQSVIKDVCDPNCGFFEELHYRGNRDPLHDHGTCFKSWTRIPYKKDLHKNETPLSRCWFDLQVQSYLRRLKLNWRGLAHWVVVIMNVYGDRRSMALQRAGEYVQLVADCLLNAHRQSTNSFRQWLYAEFANLGSSFVTCHLLADHFTDRDFSKVLRVLYETQGVSLTTYALHYPLVFDDRVQQTLLEENIMTALNVVVWVEGVHPPMPNKKDLLKAPNKCELASELDLKMPFAGPVTGTTLPMEELDKWAMQMPSLFSELPSDYYILCEFGCGMAPVEGSEPRRVYDANQLYGEGEHVIEETGE